RAGPGRWPAGHGPVHAPRDDGRSPGLRALRFPPRPGPRLAVRSGPPAPRLQPRLHRDRRDCKRHARLRRRLTGMGRRPAPVTGDPVRPHPAATVVLLRPGADGLEVLLTRRPSTMAFAAGMMVFPGGRVDAADSDPGLAARSALTPAAAAERLGGGAEPELAAALHVAAIRELFEE